MEEDEKCIECGMPVDEKTKCMCVPAGEESDEDKQDKDVKCVHCCNCAEQCPNNCKAKSQDLQG
jgi:hypothetical protein